ASGFQYHPSGAVTEFVSGNGVFNRFTYDAKRYWPKSISAGPLNLTYDYNGDGVGNVGTIADGRTDADWNQSFAYDNLGRLRYAKGRYGEVWYSYDVHGNRTNTNQGAYTYLPGTLRLQSTVANTFLYDNNGNMTSRSGLNPGTFTYAPDNTLITAETNN